MFLRSARKFSLRPSSSRASSFLPRRFFCAGSQTDAEDADILNSKCGEFVGKIAKTLPRPQWAHTAQTSIFPMLEKLHICLPKYHEFLTKTKKTDVRRADVFMNDEASGALAEFYLCCALKLRPDDIEAAGQESAKLLQIAGDVATKDVEPFLDEVRTFVDDYDHDIHQNLEETTPFMEIDQGLFWHHNFLAASKTDYEKLLAKAKGTNDEKWEQELSGEAKVVAEQWLDKSAMSVKAVIRDLLIRHGLIVGKISFQPQSRSPPPEPSDGNSKGRETVL